MRIGSSLASDLLREAASKGTGQFYASWVERVEKLSALCAAGTSKTHIAFLGTAILAKAADLKVDLFAIKPEHSPGNNNAFSARSLCHGVLVPLAAELGISLGVTGREPLNNQPYFRMTRLDDGTPVHSGGRRAFDYMVGLTRELQEISDESQAKDALRAYVAVRRGYQKTYADFTTEGDVIPEKLIEAIMSFVRKDSEGGRRAQAVVAGLLDVFAGNARVESGRINDPSRKYPGDVCIRAASNPSEWKKAFEVRDKSVSVSDARIFAKKCIDMGVREAAIVMVSESQEPFDVKCLNKWASSFGIGMTLFVGWPEFVNQVIFWAEQHGVQAATMAAQTIRERLVAVEASAEAIQGWEELVGSKKSS